MQIQSDKAKKYLNLREELKSIEIGLFVYNIEKYKKDLEELVQSIEVMQNQAKEILEWYDDMKQIIPSWYLNKKTE